MKLYLVQLDNFRKAPTDLIAARKFFEQKEYAWAVKEIKDYMGIGYKIKVRVRDDIKNPARILLPIPFPPAHIAKNYRFEIEIHKNMKDDFEVFVVNVSHELAHLLLHSNDSDCKYSEKATDVAAMLAGFGYFVWNLRKKSTISISLFNKVYGYLSNEEINFVYDCIVNDRRFRIKPKSKVKNKKPGWFRSLMDPAQ